jgi:hypothetical protein
MFNRSNLTTCSSIVLVILLIAFLAGCAAKKQFWGDPTTGLILQYQMPKDQVLKYQISNKMTQNVEVMGNAMETRINTGYVFSVKSKGLKRINHHLDITIDSMELDVSSPQGDLSPDVSSVIGKSFNMVLSNLGKELDLSGAESIAYEMGPSGERSIVSDFQAVFPDMAGKPVKIGDTWTTHDTINVKGGNADLRLTFENINTLKGLETVNGMECVKVIAAVTGTMTGEGQQGPANLYFEGDIEATDTWYFAYKKGVFVKAISEGQTEADIAVTGEQKMTIPMTMKTNFETKLIK